MRSLLHAVVIGATTLILLGGCEPFADLVEPNAPHEREGAVYDEPVEPMSPYGMPTQGALEIDPSGTFAVGGMMEQRVIATTCKHFSVGDVAFLGAEIWHENGELTVYTPGYPVLSGEYDAGDSQSLAGVQMFMDALFGDQAERITCTVQGTAQVGDREATGTMTEALESDTGEACQTTASYTMHYEWDLLDE